MWQKSVRFLIVVWILSIFFLSLYVGFSYHAEKFCTISSSSYSGRNGSVAIWLQCFGSVSTMLFIIWTICIHLSYYQTCFYNGHREMNEKTRRNSIKKFGLYMFDFIFAHFFLDGLFIFLYVLNACTHNRISDNYCYIATRGYGHYLSVLLPFSNTQGLSFYGAKKHPLSLLHLFEKSSSDKSPRDRPRDQSWY